MRGLKTFAGAATAAAILGFSTAAFAQAAAPQPDPPKPAAATEHEMKAKEIAGKDPYLVDLATKGYWCMSPSASVKFRQVSGAQAHPVQAFDNLYIVGTYYVSAYILKTSAGLIVWDTLNNEQEAKDILVPGMKQFNLKPEDIKLVILTHGHADHYGGAKYLQDTYHVPIALSEADWTFMANTAATRPNSPPPPTKDRVLTDGQKITIGDTTVEVVLTPGHSPATVSSIVTVKEKSVPHVMALWGGTAYPATMEALGEMRTSIQHFKERAQAAGASGILNTHGFFDKINERVLSRGTYTSENPLIIGPNRVQGSLAIYAECLEAQAAWYTAQGRK